MGHHVNGSADAERLSRRTMLKGVAAGAAGAWMSGSAPGFLYAEDRGGTGEVIIGSGEHRYRCLHDWGRASLPDDHEYGGTSHGVALDSNGFIYITHYGRPGSVFVFDPDGKFVRAMGERLVVNGHGGGHGISIRHEGSEEFMYLSPSEPTLPFTKMSLSGEIVWERGREQLHADSGLYEGDRPYRPTNVSFRPDGGYYLGDGYGSDYVHAYDADDRYVRSIGGEGEADGQFRTPHGQWLDDRDGTPKLVVCDRANARLQWFDLDGQHLYTVDGFLFPADIDTRGELMLVPDLHARVTILDTDNQPLVHLGDDPQWREEAIRDFEMRQHRDRWQPGKFIHPHDARFDAEGNIYMAEWVVGGRITKLERVD